MDSNHPLRQPSRSGPLPGPPPEVPDELDEGDWQTISDTSSGFIELNTVARQKFYKDFLKSFPPSLQQRTPVHERRDDMAETPGDLLYSFIHREDESVILEDLVDAFRKDYRSLPVKDIRQLIDIIHEFIFRPQTNVDGGTRSRKSRRRQSRKTKRKSKLRSGKRK